MTDVVPRRVHPRIAILLATLALLAVAFVAATCGGDSAGDNQRPADALGEGGSAGDNQRPADALGGGGSAGGDNLVRSYQQEFEQIVEECTSIQRAAHGYVAVSEVELCASKFNRMHRFFQSDDARARMSFDDFDDWRRRASREVSSWDGRANECRDAVDEYKMCPRTLLH